MTSCWITDINEFYEIKDDWDFALKKSNADRPYLLSDLIITWWKVYNKNKKLRIFIVYNNRKEIVAGFPLYIRRTKLKKGAFRRISQVGDGFANLTEPFYIISVGDFLSIFTEELRKLKEWDFTEFGRIKIDFLKLFENKFLDYKTQLSYDQNPLILIKSNAGEYLATRGKNLKRNVRRYRKKAEEIGKVTLEKVEEIEKIDQYTKMLISFSIESRVERGKVSSFNDDLQKNFVINVSKVFASKRRIDLHVLKYGENIVAVTIGWRYGDGYKYILTSYNPKYSHTHPGYILTYELLEWAYQNQDSYFDMFSGGKVFYKRDWCNSFPELLNVQFFNNSCLGNMAYYALSIERKIKTHKN